METGEKKIAVLIDADNVSADYLSFIFDELSNHGAPTIKRIYGDFTSARLVKWKSILLDYSITPIQQYSYTTGKNSTDSALIIDAMDILYAQNVDGFCIVSSDSDFTRLAARLREAGKFVIGMGEKKTPPPFVNACEQFKYLEVLQNANDGMGQESGHKANSPHIQTSSPSRAAVERAISSILNDVSDADGWASLGTVGQRLNTRYSAFDSRNYGYSKLSQLVDSFNRFEVQARKMPNQHEAQTFIRFSANKGRQQKASGRSQNSAPQKPQGEDRQDGRNARMSKKRTPDRPMHLKETRPRNETFVSDEDFLIPVQEDAERLQPAGYPAPEFPAESDFLPAAPAARASEEDAALASPEHREMPQAPFRLSDYPDLFGDLTRLDENELLGAMLEGTSDKRGKADRLSEPETAAGSRGAKRDGRADAERAPEPAPAPETAAESLAPEKATEAETAPAVQEKTAPGKPEERLPEEASSAGEAAAEDSSAKSGTSADAKTTKRGRKKAAAKEPPATGEQGAAAQETPAPGKQDAAAEEAAAPEEPVRKTARRSRKKAAEETPAETASPAPEEAPAEEKPKPAKRGRKKAVPEETTATEEQAAAAEASPAEEPVKKTARRSRKKAAEQTPAETASPAPEEAPAEETPKPAKRGRKKAVPEETPASAEETPAPEEAPKKTVRRSRKKAAEEAAAAEEAPAEPAKPARRTRKKAAAEEPAPADGEEKKPARRTRTAKKAPAEPEA